MCTNKEKKEKMKYTEDSILYWRKRIAPLFVKTKRERNTLLGNESLVAKFIALEGTVNNPILLFKTIPTYLKFNKSIPKGITSRTSEKKQYEIRIKLLDLKSWIRNKKIFDYTQEEFEGMLNIIDVQLDCSCMAFHWWGCRYNLSKMDSAIYTTNIPDPIMGKKLNYKPSVCKHLGGILYLIKPNSKKLLDLIKKKYKSKR